MLIRITEQLDRKLLHRLNRRTIPSFAQLRYILKILTPRETKTLLASVSIVFVALVLLGGRFWLRVTIPVPAVGGSYTEGLIGSPRFINPVLAQGSDADRDLTALVFSGILKNTSDGTLEPDLAESIVVSDDQKVYTVRLREKLTWHDGEPLTIDDVLYTIKTIKDPAVKSPVRASFAGVETDRIDDKTISFTLKEPFPSFRSALTVGIIPEHVWYSIPSAQAQLAEVNLKPIGSGPFRFRSITKDSNGSIRNIALARNDSYYGTLPFIKELLFKFYGDVPTAVEALKNKNVEGLGFVTLEYQTELAALKTISLLELNLAQYNALFFNPERNDALKDKGVRKALTISIDRDRIIREILGDNAVTVDAPIIPGFTETNDIVVPYDVEQAKKLLEESGWKFPAATSTTRFNKDAALAIELTTIDQPQNENALELVKESWESIGVATTIRTIVKEKIKKEVIEPRAYQVLLFGQIINSAQDTYAFWHSSQNRHPGNNLAPFANKDIDASLEQIRNASDPALVPGLYEKFVQKLAEEQFAIFLYSPNYLYPISKKIHGVASTFRITTPADRFATISSWYIATKRRLK
ncbi:MAG: peptide ABC transporter substrate-binding protein [Candidatus Komeilibacteria bacterium]|nr:peptide ABC transporter substrate-binding protein [Candidatus Komeilibacteria bacterium]